MDSFGYVTKLFDVFVSLFIFITMLKWTQLHKRSYLRRMFNDTEQADAGLRINMNDTLDHMFVVICDTYLIVLWWIRTHTYQNKLIFFNTLITVIRWIWLQNTNENVLVHSILSKTTERPVYIKLEPWWSDMNIQDYLSFYLSNSSISFLWSFEIRKVLSHLYRIVMWKFYFMKKCEYNVLVLRLNEIIS